MLDIRMITCVCADSSLCDGKGKKSYLPKTAGRIN